MSSSSTPVALSFPSRILVGGGAVSQVASLLTSLKASRPLIVTDAFMVKNVLLTHLTDPLKQQGITFDVHACPIGEPTETVVREGVKVFQDGGYDALVAIGGGSSMDTAKAMVVLAGGGGRLRDWKVPAVCDMPVVPLICVPTTAGTGSEVTRFTVITDDSSDPEEKMLIAGPSCLPVAAVVDYEMTFSVPPRVTADTGLDALTHALEAYVSVKASPTSDALALSAMNLIYNTLRTAFHEPKNASARESMMLGATQAGMAFSNSSVALVHGMSRPIGAFFHVPHGLSNAMLLPAITAFSISAAPDRYATAARAMGCADVRDDDGVACDKLVRALQALNSELEVPSPKAYGIDQDAWARLLPTMADQALASGSPANNPRSPSAAEIIDLYQTVYA